MDEDIIFFDKTHSMLKTIKSYIIDQCEDICRQEIDKETVNQEFLKFDFGYIRKIVRAKSSIINFRKKHKETVHSFILCNYEQNNNKQNISINIQILCNSKNNSYNNKDGVNLLNIIETKARDENIKNINLFSLGNPHLKQWYEKQGFKTLGELSIPGSKKIKVYIMKKQLD
jgi:hypothetical protein